jgi:hypothetical protein
MVLYQGAQENVQLGDQIAEELRRIGDSDLAETIKKLWEETEKPLELITDVCFELFHKEAPVDAYFRNVWNRYSHLLNQDEQGQYRETLDIAEEEYGNKVSWGGIAGSVILLAGLITFELIAWKHHFLNTDPGRAVNFGFAALFFLIAAVKTAKAFATYTQMTVNLSTRTPEELARAAAAQRDFTEAGRASAKVGAIVTFIVIAIVIGVFIYEVVKQGVHFASLEFDQMLACTIATIIVLLLLFAISLIPVVGNLIVAVIVLIDTLVSLVTGGKYSFTGLLTEVIVKAIYGVSVAVDAKPELGNSGLSVSNPEEGIVAGNTLHYSTTVTTTATHTNPTRSAWQAHFYLYLWSENQLRSTTFKYQLDNSPETVSAHKNEMKDSWQDVQKDHSYGGHDMLTAWAAGGQLQIDTTLTPGINRTLPIQLNTGYAVPVVECWTYWIFPPLIPVPICYDRSATGSVSTDLGQSITLDVLPATLDEFYALNWDSGFGPQKDHDGDGRISRAWNGDDPDDTRWDTDGDGLSDDYELRLRAAQFSQGGATIDPLMRDTDWDGLSDGEEIHLGTNPARPDTDGDGLSDKEEIDGWSFTYGGTQAAPLQTRVFSDPLLVDPEGDGLDDHVERLLHLADPLHNPYHPRVWNESPIALQVQVDAVVKPGQHFNYQAGVQNNLQVNPPLYAAGWLTSTVPAPLVGAGISTPFDLAQGQMVTVTAPLYVPTNAAGQDVTITNVMSSHLHAARDWEWDPVSEITTGTESSTLTLDDVAIVRSPEWSTPFALVTSEELPGFLTPNYADIYVQQVTADGNFTGGHQLVVPHNWMKPAMPILVDMACNNYGNCPLVYGNVWGAELLMRRLWYDPARGIQIGSETLLDKPVNLQPPGFAPLAVTTDGANFLVGWNRRTDTTLNLYVQRLITDTSTSGGMELLDSAGASVLDLAWAGIPKQYLVAWGRGGNVGYAFVSPTSGHSSWQQLNGHANASVLKVAYDPLSNRSLFVYNAACASARCLYGRLLSGSSLSNEILLSQTDALSLTVTSDPRNRGWVLAWVPPGQNVLHYQAVTPDGALRGPEQLYTWLQSVGPKIDLACMGYVETTPCELAGSYPGSPVKAFLDRLVLRDMRDLGHVIQDAYAPIAIDVDPPTSTVTSLTDGQYVPDTGTLIVGGQARDPAFHVTQVEVSVDGNWQPANGAESWAYAWPTKDYAEGPHTIRTRATDTVGHVESPGPGLTVTLDRTPPTIATNIANRTILAATLDAHGRWVVPLQGTVSDPNAGSRPGSGVRSVEVLLEGQAGVAGNTWQPATLTPAGGWSLNYVLPIFNNDKEAMPNPTGSYTFLSRATDNVGNQTAAGHGVLLSIQVDNTAPLADLQYTGPSTTTITTTVTLSGVVTDPGSAAAGLSRLQMAFVPGEQVDVVSGTIVLLHFDEPAGAQRFEDSSGQGHHGACSGTSCPTAGVSGKVDQALSFDGANDYVEVSPSDTLNPGNELTLSAWVKLVNPANDQKIMGKTTIYDGYLLAVKFGKLDAEIWDTTRTDYHLAAGTVPANTWTHLAVTWQTGGQMIGYINGTEVGRLAASAKPIGNNTMPLRVGVAPWDPAWFGVNGLLDEVTVYNRALAAWEVQALYQAGSLAWADTTLAASGPGITTTTWSQAAPQGLEGIYQIDLRGTDVLHNRNEQRLTWNAWRGQVDTLAPQASISAVVIGFDFMYQTLYHCWAQDFNLYERTDPHDPTPAAYDFQCPCPAIATRTTYDQVSPWYRSQFTDTTRLYALTATCTVPGRQTGTVTVHACDIFGHCTDKQTSPQLSLLSSNDNLPLLDAVVLSPAPGSVLTTTGPISVTGGAYARDYLKALTITADSAPLATLTWPSNTVTDTLWNTTWTPSGEGAHTLLAIAEDWAGRVQTDTHPATVIVDTQPPSIDISPTVLTSTQRLSFGRVALTGLATDTGGIAAVAVQVDGGLWQRASLHGPTWRYPWYLGSEPDGATYTVSARATDVAAHTAQVTETVTVDLVPPTPVTVTLSYVNNLGVRQPITPGQTVREAVSALFIEWTPSSDGSGVGAYLAGWSATPTPPSPYQGEGQGGGGLAAYAPEAERRHVQPFDSAQGGVWGEAQTLYAYVIIRDIYGNERQQVVGPIYLDTPLTPDIIAMYGQPDGRPYHDWLASGCTQIGADREVWRNARPGAALKEIQRLYATWDDQALRLTWTGANWNSDGDLFIYLDTGQPGGATVAYNPYTATTPGPVIGLPAQNGRQLAADYLLWVEDAHTVRLLRWDGQGWVEDAPFPAAYYRLDTTLSPDYTDLYVPFSLLGITYPAATTLGMVALASEENALQLWAAMPDKNPLNSPRVINAPMLVVASQHFTLTQQYEWPSLGLGLCPSAGKFTDADLQVDITADPPGVEVGFLEHDLPYLLTPDTWLDANLDGGVDLPLPVDVHPAIVHDGQAITYTVHYANYGTEVAPGVRITATAHGALHFAGNDTLVLDLGGVGAGISGTLTFVGQVAAARNGDTAEMKATVADATHGPFDWLWVQHDVDSTPPISLAIRSPLAYIRPGSNTVLGTVHDRSGVPYITLQVRAPNGATTDIACPDPTPRDGQWACRVDVGTANDGDPFALRAQATDSNGHTSGWTDWHPLIVDTLPPTVTLDADVEIALSDGIIGPGESIFSGLVYDNRQARAVEVCFDRPSGQRCSETAVRPGIEPAGQWHYALSTRGADGITQTIYLYGLDGVDNHSTVPLSRTYQVDAVPPVVTVTTVITQVLLSDYRDGVNAVPVLSGAVSDGGGVSAFYVVLETPAGNRLWNLAWRSGATWSYTPRLQMAGRHILRIQAIDRAGNVSAYGPFPLEVVGPVLDKKLYLPLLLKNWRHVTGSR